MTAMPVNREMESDLALEFLRVVEKAAIASAKTMGLGDRTYADQVATTAMRQTLDTVPMHGTIVIGESERDQAPMLFSGEQVGTALPAPATVPAIAEKSCDGTPRSDSDTAARC